MKYDSHVRTAFKHFFPIQIFLACLLLSFILGFIIGNVF